MKRFVRYSLFLILYSVMIFAAPKIMAFTGPTCTAPSSCSILTASGTYLGVGTTNPNAPLDILGNGAHFQFGNPYWGPTGYQSLNYWYTSNGNVFSIQGNNSNNGWSSLSLNPYGGNVGIATTTPGYPLTVSGNIYTSGAFIGALSGGLSAANISSDVFGRLQGNGNFAFPASLGVATTTQNGLPQALSVYGGGYFSGNVGIGTTGPSTLLQVGNGGTTGKISVNSQDNSYGQFQIGNPSSGGEASMSFISGVTGFGGAPTSANGTSYVWDIGAGNYGIGGNKFSIGNQSYGGPILVVQANGNVGIGNYRNVLFSIPSRYLDRCGSNGTRLPKSTN